MKKSNWLAYIVAIIISAFLLWLWFWLGFDHIDAPLDLVLSIIWWCLVALACFLIYRMEKKRREKARRCYIGPGFVFNGERGVVDSKENGNTVDIVKDILENIDYTFEVKDALEAEYIACIHSKKFEKAKESSRDDGEKVRPAKTWEGEVVAVQEDEEYIIAFSNEEELCEIVSQLPQD